MLLRRTYAAAWRAPPKKVQRHITVLLLLRCRKGRLLRRLLFEENNCHSTSASSRSAQFQARLFWSAPTNSGGETQHGATLTPAPASGSVVYLQSDTEADV